MFIIISFLSAFWQICPWIRPFPVDAHLEMEVRTGGAPGAAGEGDDVSRIHRLACFCQQLGAVAVQRGKAIAVVDHRIGSDVFVGNEDIRSFSFPV